MSQKVHPEDMRVRLNSWSLSCGQSVPKARTNEIDAECFINESGWLRGDPGVGKIQCCGTGRSRDNQDLGTSKSGNSRQWVSILPIGQSARPTSYSAGGCVGLVSFSCLDHTIQCLRSKWQSRSHGAESPQFQACSCSYPSSGPPTMPC
jgi:hypothetical protein